MNAAAKNGLTPLHLCAREDRVEVAKILVSQAMQLYSVILDSAVLYIYYGTVHYSIIYSIAAEKRSKKECSKSLRQYY